MYTTENKRFALHHDSMVLWGNRKFMVNKSIMFTPEQVSEYTFRDLSEEAIESIKLSGEEVNRLVKEEKIIRITTV